MSISKPDPVESQAPPRRFGALYLGLVVAVLVLFVLGPSAIGGLFLWRAGEFMAVSDVVADQQTNGAKYGSALHDDEFDYKLQLATVRRAEIMALGSSRMLQFREALFSRSFTNAGRAMSSLDEGVEFLGALPRDALPRVLILGVDPWWFNPNRLAHTQRRPRLVWDLGAVERVADWLRQSKIGLDDLWRVAVLGDRGNDLTSGDNIGVAAIIRAAGYRADGSRDYGQRYFDADPTFDDQGFANTLARLTIADGPFEFGDKVAADRLAQFDAMLKSLGDLGVIPVVILPPYSQPLMAAMAEMGNAYDYVAQVRAYVSGLKVESHDFLDGARIGADDCEFIDGFHGGEIVYQRMLAHIVENNPQSALAALVDLPSLRASIAAAPGRALSAASAAEYAVQEADFLHLGCAKGGP